MSGGGAGAHVNAQALLDKSCAAVVLIDEADRSETVIFSHPIDATQAAQAARAMEKHVA